MSGKNHHLLIKHPTPFTFHPYFQSLFCFGFDYLRCAITIAAEALKSSLQKEEDKPEVKKIKILLLVFKKFKFINMVKRYMYL